MFVLTAPPGINNFESGSGASYVVSADRTISVPLNDLRDALVAGFSMSSAGGGRIVNKTSDAFGTTDTILEVNQSGGPCSIIGPLNAVAWLREWTLKDGGLNADQFPITLTPSSGLIDGLPSLTLDKKGQSVKFYSNGTDLRISG